LIKPLKGSGGTSIRQVYYEEEAREEIGKLLKREEHQRDGLFIEKFHAFGHHIEIPFLRDNQGNILFPPEIESSIQRRYQKVFQESPSINISDAMRRDLYRYAQQLTHRLNYVGLGSLEFIAQEGNLFFSELNPTVQINTLVPELHLASNLIKMSFAVSRGEPLPGITGVEIIPPTRHVVLVSLMAENPFYDFQPSSGTVKELYSYSSLETIFKTYLHSGASMSPLYDPYIGKIATFSGSRRQALQDLKKFLNRIIIRGIKTNLPYLRFLLGCESVAEGRTTIDSAELKCNFFQQKKKSEDILIAAAIMASAFHVENMKKSFSSKPQHMGKSRLLKWPFKKAEAHHEV